MRWYYANDGKRVGPVSVEEFDRLTREGVVKPSTLVWRQGMKDWVPFSTVGTDVPAVDDGTELCAASGKRYPRREMIQFEGKWISGEHRDAYFQRMREGVAQPNSMVYGSFLARFCAKFVDGVINWVISAMFNAVLALIIFGSPNFFTAPMDHARTSALLVYQLISIPLGLVLGLAYVWFFISRYDATPGKMALGLKLVRADGSKLSTGRIIGRHFAEILSAMILLMGYIMAAFDDERRTLHDRICDTRVIKAK